MKKTEKVKNNKIKEKNNILGEMAKNLITK